MSMADARQRKNSYMGDHDESQRQTLVLPISEFVVVFAALSFLFALVLPTVNSAREHQGLPSELAALAEWYEPHPWLFIVVFTGISTITLTCLMLGIRAILPRSARIRIPWKSPPQRTLLDRPKRESGRPAIWSSVAAFAGTAFLVLAALHARADRSGRRPVVTWEGPVADYVLYVALLGWLLSLVAAIVAAYALSRYRSRSNILAYVTMFFVFGNFFYSVIFWAAIYED
ncbi:MAG: hypothetical protein ABFC88_08880 [Thermoguttaceae bacterium]